MQIAHVPLQARFDSSGLCLLESSHAADFRMQWRVEDYDKIIAPLGGSGVICKRAGRREMSWRLQPGMVVLVESGVPNRIVDSRSSPLRLYILCMGQGFPFRQMRRQGGLTGEGVHARSDSATVAQTLAGLREIAALDDRTQGRRVLRCGLAAALMGRLLAGGGDQAESLDARGRVEDFIRRLEGGFFVGRSIDEAARDVSLSRRRFTQLFAEIAGESYHVRVHRLRIGHAMKLLRQGERSPVAAAFECGYEDVSTFYRAFKRHTGMAPLEWMAVK